MLRDATAGDPMGGLRWTHKTTRNLAAGLRRRGFAVSYVTVARLLRQQQYSLRTNRKRMARTKDPERNRQFRLLTRRRRCFLRRGWPMISVDTKKKELIGNFKNSGRSWRRRSRDVLDHDFPNWAKGRGIPYGIYDEGHNAGLAVVGVSRDTPEFAIAAIRYWWRTIGRLRYPKTKRLGIEGDGGGSNGHRSWRWKIGLQRLADEFDLTITVGHFPPGASKWNPIEHRMFNLISANWAGEPLTSYETVLKFIRTTCSSTGFHCRAHLDTTKYQTKIPVAAEDKAKVKLNRSRVLPKWNYTIRPRQGKKQPNGSLQKNG